MIRKWICNDCLGEPCRLKGDENAPKPQYCPYGFNNANWRVDE